MKIIIPDRDNAELRGDIVPFIVIRSDLMAMPSTIECLIRANEDIFPYIQEGKTIAVAHPETKYRIIFSMKKSDGILHQGNPDYQLFKIIGVLESCYPLTKLAEKAVNKENTSMAVAFRASGAKIAVGADVKVDKFTCLIGEYPTYGLMRALARSACVPVWDGKNKLTFTRLRDLFEKAPREILHQDTTQTIQSEFLERHETPAYYSNTASGGISQGSATTGRKSDYEMFANEQTLNNLSLYLVNRKIWTTKLTPNILAGDIIEIEKEKFVVITAVHAMGKAGTGTESQLSRFWLGTLSNAVDKKK